MATGFQVVAQMRDFSQLHKLYTGKTTDQQNGVTIEVPNGEYEVNIFPIIGRIGILNSSVEYRGLLSIMKENAVG